MVKKVYRISVLGGTGNLGFALAWRWARAGHQVTVGSRAADKAQAAAARLNDRVGEQRVSGMENFKAVAGADIVVLTVPFAAHQATLEAVAPGLRGQIVVDTTVPLKPPRVNVVQLPQAGSVAVMTQSYLGEKARVVAAFHNVSAKLLDQDTEIDCNILVTGDDESAKQTVLQLVADAGCDGLDAGALANSAASEAMTSVLIHLNKIYRVGHAGLVISGLNA